MNAWEDLIGVPYIEGGRDPSQGLDCMGLVLEVTARMGKCAEWREVDWTDRRRGDVLGLCVLGVTGHTGVILDDHRMIHAARGKGVCVERYTGAAWRRRITGVFRHA